ncbi:MAG TPA: cytochrome P460 family protein [Pirellulales bacterium]|nr:cytochrome P460 family protein [Pirellulales bacterium]
MSLTSVIRVLKTNKGPAIAAGALSLATLGSLALAAQDKYMLQVPNGPAFADIRGYEDWLAVAPSQPEGALKLILGNPTIIEAYRSGIPGNGKPFPEGSKLAKIVYSAKPNPNAPFAVNVPDTLKEVEFIEKDSKKYPDTHGWAYATFVYDAATDTFTPKGNDAKCGAQCHERAAATDFIFTQYAKR